MRLSVTALEVVLNGATYYTNEFESIKDLRQALDNGQTFTVFWFRSDGTRFEEEMWIQPDQVVRIATNRT